MNNGPIILIGMPANIIVHTSNDSLEKVVEKTIEGLDAWKENEDFQQFGMIIS